MTGGEKVLVSVIIPVYGGEAFVERAVDSALGQNHRHLEVVVVDDGSPDESAALVAARYADDPRVRLVRQANAGTAAARNAGIVASRGAFVALLDQDDRWLPDKLTRQLPLFDDPAVGLVHGGGHVIDSESGRVTSTYAAADELTLADLVHWCKVGCATTVMRRSVLDEVGPFDATLGGVDDWDMWIRIAAAGYRVCGVAEPTVEIFEHDGNQGRAYARLYPKLRQVIRKSAARARVDATLRPAVRDARRRARQDYYVKACRAAAAAGWRSPGTWLALRLAAMKRYPEALTHPSRRVLVRNGEMRR